MTPEDSCFICMFWDQSTMPYSKRAADKKTHGVEAGLCRRYPPVLDSASPPSIHPDNVTESPTAFVQPLTFSDDICGEIRRK